MSHTSGPEEPWRLGDDLAPKRAAFRARLAPTSPEPPELVVLDASGSRIRTVDGRRYVDWISGIGVANTGHGLEPVVRAVAQQAARYMHVMVYGEYVLEPQVRLAEFLAELLPPPLEMVYFTNSGAEAVEGAIKLARKATGRAGIIAFQGAYHGDTTGAQALAGEPSHRAPFEPLLPGVRHLPFGELSAIEAIDESVAAVFVEPIQAEGGVRVPDPAFLPGLARRCREVGALLVADEVQVGLGRAGRWLACAEWGVVPDVLVLAKALGGGMPLGAFVARRELMQILADDPPLSHLTTFGGHPVSCAAGLAALQYARDRDLPARAEALGARLARDLRDVCRARGGPFGSGLRDVRGRGLILGLEFDRPVRPLIRACLEAGLIVGDCLWAPNVLKIMPPLAIDAPDVEEGLARFERALAALAE